MLTLNHQTFPHKFMESSAQQIYFYMAVFYFHRESSFSSQPFFFKLETNQQTICCLSNFASGRAVKP